MVTRLLMRTVTFGWQLQIELVVFTTAVVSTVVFKKINKFWILWFPSYHNIASSLKHGFRFITSVTITDFACFSCVSWLLSWPITFVPQSKHSVFVQENVFLFAYGNQ